MKKLFFSIISLIMLFMGCAGSAKPSTVSDGITLEQAIKEAAARIEERISVGQKLHL